MFALNRLRRDERNITAALVASVVVHLALVLRLPQVTVTTPDETQHGNVPDELNVQLMPPPRPPVRAAAPPPSFPAPSHEARRVPHAARVAPPPKPPVLAMREPSPSPSVARPPPPQVAPAPPPSPPAGDFASLVEARRRARGETNPVDSAPAAAPGDNANARANRLAAANLASGRNLSFGHDPRRSGGVFQITRQSYDYAEFMFFGWNTDMERNTSQVITVDRGNAPDIRLAVVRKMISIIRHYEQGDFVWESVRLGRNVTLSARVRDTAGLEDFLLKEFFPEWIRSAGSAPSR